MTDNEKIKIVRWMGLYKGWSDADMLKTFVDHIPDYSTDAEAVQLLNVLAEKGYGPGLLYNRGTPGGWYLLVFDGDVHHTGGYKPTIHEAIVAAVLEVIKREQDGNQ